MATRTNQLIEATKLDRLIPKTLHLYNKYWYFIFDSDAPALRTQLQELFHTQASIHYLSFALEKVDDKQVTIGYLELTGRLKEQSVKERLPLFADAILRERELGSTWGKIARLWVHGDTVLKPLNENFVESPTKAQQRGRPRKADLTSLLEKLAI